MLVRAIACAIVLACGCSTEIEGSYEGQLVGPFSEEATGEAVVVEAERPRADVVVDVVRAGKDYVASWPGCRVRGRSSKSRGFEGRGSCGRESAPGGGNPQPSVAIRASVAVDGRTLYVLARGDGWTWTFTGTRQ